MHNTKKGFTLIELLIVITIIGILAAVMLPTILGAPVKGRDANRKVATTTLVTAIEAFVAGGDNYSDLATGCIADNDAELLEFIPGGKMPTDPSGAPKLVVGALTCHYYFCLSADTSRNYVIISNIEDTEQGNFTSTAPAVAAAVCGTPAPTLADTGNYHVVVQ